MLTVDEARARLVELVGVLPPVPVSLAAARGLVLGAGITAGRDLPGFDNSAMDGFAVRAADTTGGLPGSPVRLRIVGEVPAGSEHRGTIGPGEAVRIMTGAPVPAGADAIVEVELTATEGDMVVVQQAVDPGRSVRRAGGDVHCGEEVLGPGTWLGPAQLALLAALGATEPVCHPRPRVAVIATGDELVDPATIPGPGQVADVVSTALPAAIESAGAEPLLVRRAADTEDDVRRAFRDARGADLVVTVGGVSMGDFDFVRSVIEGDGELDFWRVAMRPGKPLAAGRVGGLPVIGLPGNPVSALVGFEVYVVPALLAMSGRAGWSRPRRTATLDADLSTPVGLQTFTRAVLSSTEGGGLTVTPVSGQGSHQVRSMAEANALIDTPAEAGDIRAGTLVEAIVLDAALSPW